MLKKRQNWIVEKIEKKKANLQVLPKRQYVSGESIYLFGRQYYLKIVTSGDKKVERAHNRLIVHAQNEKMAKNLLLRWVAKEFEDVASNQVTKCLEKFASLYAPPKSPKVEIRNMRKRWGSCTSDGKILINSKLASAAIECVEYVIFHELAHLIEPTHGSRFYKTLEELCPNYQELKHKLDFHTVLHED